MNTALITTKVVKIPQVWSSLSDSQVLMKHQFQNNRRTTRTLPNSTVSTYNYDDSSRLTGIQTTLNQNTIDSLAYTLDNVGNRVSKTQNSAIVDYTYDNIYRLTNVSPTGTAQLPETYTYDAVGNRTTSGNDQFPQTNETVVYSYDDENRLTGVTITQGSNVKQLAFAYDPFGRRIKKTIVQDTIGTDCTSPNTCPRTTNYIYDGQSIIMEYDQNSNITAKYTHGPNIDEPLAVQQGTNIYYYHADGLGSITGLSNTSGSIVQTYSYDSFGNMTTTGSISQPFTYTAREYDSETGMYFYRARYYDPTVGRFVTKDPISFAGGDVNLYNYVGANPINWSDPIGLYKLNMFDKNRDYERWHAADETPDRGDDFIDLYGHGSQSSFARRDAKGVYDLIKNLLESHPSIYFHSCHAGEGENSIAKELAKMLPGYDIYASPYSVYNVPNPLVGIEGSPWLWIPFSDWNIGKGTGIPLIWHSYENYKVSK
jgi:RHS repeat-associated protein